MRTILIMAGGTGGHIFPALAVAEELRDDGWTIVWLGSKAGMESKLVPPMGYRIEWVRFSGLRGKGLLRAVLLPLNLLVAFWQSASAIFRVRPDVILGMGGYISFPGGMMAALLSRPLVLHEQNSIAGLANKVLARIADTVLVAFPGALRKAEWTGNPIRRDITHVPGPDQRFKDRSGNLRLLVVGGSLGAQALNETVPRALALIPESQRPEVTHQAGEKHLAQLEGEYRRAGVRATTLAFIGDMATAYANADMVICRAGALTVSELAAVGVASVLVPFPFAVDDHQTTNARYLSDRDAAILIPQAELTPQRLADLVLGFTRGKLLEMANRARALGKPEAARIVADRCMAAAA
ncbi:MAG TPA: undecaprenyldiphospho-muramoylpentapeptide beta-N-acetylglucosaminyltransferase [Burkholderiales bacterium]|nr:undecaprenyldiphospho-muramoylpentapeptide beta-N-acetylglucosaminyltransferase [Burkholderiales bacterium]